MQPTVSVIVPTHNRAHLVGDAIASVLGQTLTDLELIVVDDGSTDDTPEVVGRETDARLQYVRQEHAGRSEARNRGLALASGRYIGFLDDDDLYLPDKLAAEAALLDTLPKVGLVAAGTRIVRDGGEVIGEARPWLHTPHLGPIECLSGCSLLPPAVLIRRQAIDALDHAFDSVTEPAEDADFFIRLVLTGCQVEWRREIDSYYRLLGFRRATLLFENSVAYQRVLRKIFARPDLPAYVRAREQDVLLSRYLFTAFRSLAFGQQRPAQRDLLHALVLAPDAIESRFVAEMLRVARTPYFVRDAVAFVNDVFDHLPPGFDRLAPRRGEALSALLVVTT